jgi:CBS domain-containing protein
MTPRRLTETIVRPPLVVCSDARVGDALAAMVAADLPAVAVVDSDGHYRGVFGEREVIRALFPPDGRPGAARRAAVGDYADTACRPVETTCSEAAIAAMLARPGVPIVPVVEHRRPVGMVTRRDFARALADRPGSAAARQDGEGRCRALERAQVAVGALTLLVALVLVVVLSA